MPTSSPTAAQACLGVALFGWGASILLGIVPHEDLWVGAGLAVVGAALVAAAPVLPVVRVPAWALVAMGMAISFVLAATSARLHARLDLPKAALFCIAVTFCALAPIADGTFPWRGQRVPVASIAVGLAAALVAPLLAWSLQATFKSATGATPIEAFVHYGLVIPVSWFVAALGWHPVVAGQDLMYDTPSGQLVLQVGAACSGIEAMAVFTGVLAVYLLTQRPPGGTFALWALVGLVGVYAVNVLRIMTLTVVGHAWGVDALLRVHAQAGWIFFVGWAIAFAWLAKRYGAATDRLGPSAPSAASSTSLPPSSASAAPSSAAPAPEGKA